MLPISAQAEKLINDVIADFGTFDILVNNAGHHTGYFVASDVGRNVGQSDCC